jgi:hypothetical protein
MFKSLLVAGTTLMLVIATPTLVQAHPSSHMSSQGFANNNGLNAPDRDFGRDRAEDRGNRGFNHRGGHSSSHMSTRGFANTNGPNAVDRELGRNRATLRHTHHPTR